MSSSLPEFFRSQSWWRSDVADRYPDDPRNLQAAAALDSLAEYVELDEDDDPDAERVTRTLTPFLRDGSTLGGDTVAREVSRYGYGYNVGASQHQEFLEELVGLCFEDAYESAQDTGDDWSGMLAPFELQAARDGVVLPSRYWQVRGRGQQTESELEEAVASYRGDD